MKEEWEKYYNSIYFNQRGKEATTKWMESNQTSLAKLKKNGMNWKEMEFFCVCWGAWLMDGMEGLGWLFFGGLRAAAAASAPQRERPAQPNNPSFINFNNLFHRNTNQTQQENSINGMKRWMELI